MSSNLKDVFEENAQNQSKEFYSYLIRELLTDEIDTRELKFLLVTIRLSRIHCNWDLGNFSFI